MKRRKKELAAAAAKLEKRNVEREKTRKTSMAFEKDILTRRLHLGEPLDVNMPQGYYGYGISFSLNL